MRMPRLLRVLFTRSDPVMDQAVEEVKQSGAAAVSASNRLHATINDLLERNDTLTFRRPNVQGNNH